MKLTLSRSVLLATLLATSIIFGLPHLVIPSLLGANQSYTPFAVTGVSSVTYDETATYAALANYTALRFKPPYDTDVWETQDIPVPVTTVPFFALAVLDRVSGSLATAFMLCDFVLPPLAVLIVFALLFEFTHSFGASIIGSLSTIFIAFGPRNFFGVPLLLATGRQTSIIQPLEYSRILHPEVSFTLFAVALLLLWRTVRSGRRLDAGLAGVLGGLLFYTYVYYFAIWLGACTLLLVGGRWLPRQTHISLSLVNAATWLVSVPFWLSVWDSNATQNYTVRLARHYSEVGHVPPTDNLAYTAAYCIIFGLLVACFFGLARPSRERALQVLLFHGCLFLAGIAALNAEIVIGFNLEAMSHYANRFFQPFLTVSGFALLAPAVASVASKHRPVLSARRPAIATYSVATLLLVTALARQAIVSVNVAGEHTLIPEYRSLFDWLNAHTNTDDVVLASPRDLNDLLPVFTHNLVFVPNGERTSASDDEVEVRFLIGMRVLQLPEREIHDMLTQDASHGEQPLGLTYTYFLFVSGNGSQNRALPEATLSPMLAASRQLDVAYELGQRRLDYIYSQGQQEPERLPGWTFDRVYSNEYGSVWHVRRDV